MWFAICRGVILGQCSALLSIIQLFRQYARFTKLYLSLLLLSYMKRLYIYFRDLILSVTVT